MPNKNKIFLGGTCAETTWRNELISKLNGIQFFNPVVEDWTPECQQIENEEKDIYCNIHLYVITKEMTGVYSIAEMIDSAHQVNKTTIIQVMPNGFGNTQLKSLKATLALAELIGAYTILSDDMGELIELLNTYSGRI